MKELDIIWLQVDFGDSPERFSELDVTWCKDQINNTDLKYLRATPKREAVTDLVEAIIQAAKEALASDHEWCAENNHAPLSEDWTEYLTDMGEAALTKAGVLTEDK